LRGLSQVNGLLGNLKECLRLERVVESLISDEDDVFLGSEFVSSLRTLLEFRRSDKVGGTTEVGDELRKVYAATDTRKEATLRNERDLVYML